MDLEIIIVNEVRQRKTASYDITYMWNQAKIIQMNLFTEQKQTQRKNLCHQVAGIDWEFGTDMYTLLYLK